MLPLIVPLFLSSLHRAENMALAMDARAYGSSPERTSLAVIPVQTPRRAGDRRGRWLSAMQLVIFVNELIRGSAPFALRSGAFFAPTWMRIQAATTTRTIRVDTPASGRPLATAIGREHCPGGKAQHADHAQDQDRVGQAAGDPRGDQTHDRPALQGRPDQPGHRPDEQARQDGQQRVGEPDVALARWEPPRPGSC